MKTIILISCSKGKLTFRAKAEDLYISHLFKASLQCAKLQSPDEIFILSAKYELLDLDRVICPYDETLKSMSTAQVKEWAVKVIEQLEEKGVSLNTDCFIFLAGDKYRKYLTPRMANYEVPMEGKRIGEQLHFLKYHCDDKFRCTSRNSDGG